MYRVEFLPAAARQLARLDRSIQRRIARSIERLALDPRGPRAFKLRGSDDVCLLVVVVAVGHRAAVYRR